MTGRRLAPACRRACLAVQGTTWALRHRTAFLETATVALHYVKTPWSGGDTHERVPGHRSDRDQPVVLGERRRGGGAPGAADHRRHPCRAGPRTGYCRRREGRDHLPHQAAGLVQDPAGESIVAATPRRRVDDGNYFRSPPVTRATAASTVFTCRSSTTSHSAPAIAPSTAISTVVSIHS